MTPKEIGGAPRAQHTETSPSPSSWRRWLPFLGGKTEATALSAAGAQPELNGVVNSALDQAAQVVTRGAARTSQVQLNALLAKVGPVSETITQRTREMPHRHPPEITFGSVDRPLDLSRLDPDQKYMWVLDPEGRFVVAPEKQPGFGVTSAQPEGRVVKHGDLAPSKDGGRGPARAGGCLRAQRSEDGQVRWVLDMDSSYSYNRVDRRVLKEKSGQAVINYLQAMGTDVTHLENGKNVYDPLLRMAGRVHGALEKLGLGRLLN
jgi:hypothetical protein